MKSLRLTIIALLMAVSGMATAQAQKVQPYLSVDQLPNIIKCLPAPPDTTSELFAHDVMRYY